jgi:ABC-type dipeptide/oligopeptide/nickel transport system permease subunit
VPEPVRASILRVNLRRFMRDRISLAAAIVAVVFVIVALCAPWLAPQDPYDTDLLRRLQPPVWMEGGDWSYVLGCDTLGRDILSRIIYGARISMSVGVAVVLLACVVGTLLGLAAGYFRGLVDVAISRTVDVLLAFPYLIFAIGLMGMMGPGLENIVLALVYKEWTISCRVVRGETLAAREYDYVTAARAVGASHRHIMWREILPNILSPVVVVATTRMATIIILEASLSFLGIGVQPPLASWGSMVADGRAHLFEAWWVSTFPGVAIFLLVLSVNVAAQGLRDAFDPRLRT